MTGVSARLAGEFPLISLAALGSGAALVAAIFLNLRLSVTLPVFCVFAAALCTLSWHSAMPERRRQIRARILAGVRGGAVGTVGYDLARVLLVRITGWHVDPFKAFVHFGHLLIGDSVTHDAAVFAGAVYHALNGLTFGIAYSLVAGHRHWALGIAWAMGLEFAMLAVYPGWLHLQSVLGEFTIMSMTGHVVYGSLLGWVTRQRLLARDLTANHVRETLP